jgi:predicted aconitase with swiveling domain
MKKRSRKQPKPILNWMVEQRFSLLPDGLGVPVRSVVQCRTKKEAMAGAAAACEEAVRVLAEGQDIALVPLGEPVVLYTI